MSRRKELFILIAGFFSLLIFTLTIVSIFVFNSFFYALWIGAIWYVLSIFLAFFILNSKKRITNVRMCWIFVILGLPILGFSIFVLFGINPLLKVHRKKYLESQEEWMKFENYEFTEAFLNDPNVDVSHRHIFAYGYNSEKRPIYNNNQIEVISKQQELYKRSIELIRSAQSFIHLQYYIIADSIWFRTIANELIKKARAGVKIRFIYDWVGSYKRNTVKIIKQLKKAGVIVVVFNPKGFTRYTSKTNFRCHRKCLIVDNKVALYGGSNIGDEYIRLAKDIIHWEDSNIVISGGVVNTLNLLFALDWKIHCAIDKSQREGDDLLSNKEKYFAKPQQEPTNGVIAQLIEKSPNYDDFELSGLVASIIGKAKKRIWIVTPYFIPNDSIIEALKVAALSGIDVRIVLPGLPDDKKYILTINRYQYDKLLNLGIKIYEYNGFIHSKLILVDDDITSVSTFNFDFRSFFINYESGLFIKDAAIASKYKEIIQNYCQVAQEINSNSTTASQRRLINFKMAFMNVFHPLI